MSEVGAIENAFRESITQAFATQYGTAASMRVGQLDVIVDAWHNGNGASGPFDDRFATCLAGSRRRVSAVATGCSM